MKNVIIGNVYLNTGNNEVMRSTIWCGNAFSTEVVPLLKLGGNEVGNVNFNSYSFFKFLIFILFILF